MIKQVLFSLFSFAVLSQASAAAEIRLCQDDVDVFPWHMKSRQGLSPFMLNEVSKRTGIAIAVESMPWKRCLAMVQTGQIDGAIAASYSQERMAIGSYPLNSQKTIDTHRRMSEEAYSLFILKNNPEQVHWNGKQLSTTTKPVAAQLGYSIVKTLQTMNILVDDSDKRPELLLRKLMLGTVSAAVLNTRQGEFLLKDPAFSGSIIQLEPPLVKREGYLLLAHDYVRSNPAQAERIWDEIAQVRESAAYQREMLSILNSAP